MIRIAHLSDLHISDGPRWDACEEGLRAAWALALESHPDAIVITGDLYGTSVPYRSQPRERNLLAELLSSAPAPVVVVLGNHDDPEDCRGLEHVGGTARLVAPVYSLSGEIQRAKGVVVITEPSYVSLGGCDLLCLPYRAAGIAEHLAGEPSPEVPVLLCAHGAIAGAAQSGGEIMREHPEIPRDVLEQGLCDGRWAGVLLGHLHHGQVIGGRIGYPGPPWRPDWRDERTEPAIILWDVEGASATPRIVRVPTRPMVTRAATWTAEGWTVDLEGQEGADLRVRATWDIGGPTPDLRELDRCIEAAAPAYYQRSTSTTGARVEIEVAVVAEDATDQERLEAAAESLGVEGAEQGIRAARWLLDGGEAPEGWAEGRVPGAPPWRCAAEASEADEPPPPERPSPAQPSLF